MKLYLDSADLNEIREVAAWGVLSGLTTNPSLLAKSGVAIADFMAEAAQLVAGPISLEVLADDHAGMLREAAALQAYGEQVVIKVPMTEEGLRAQRGLHDMGLKTNQTLIFSTNQALLAAAAGADYVSPFMGRLDDIGLCGAELIAEIRTIFKQYEIKSEIIAASVRTPREVTEAALAGADICTIPYAIIKKMAVHPLTEAGIARFKADWQRSGRQMPE